MADKDYNVFPKGDKWAVKRQDADRASSLHPTQKDAYDAAKKYANNSGGADISIHGRDGKIRDKNTIGKKDPHPPKG